MIALLAVSSCGSEETDGFERLADGSLLREVPFQGGPLLDGLRCWPSGDDFDCLAIRRFDPPTLLVTRYVTGSLSDTPSGGRRFGCLFEPAPTEWFRQVIAREPIIEQDDAALMRTVPRIGRKEEWSRPEAVELLRRNGVPANEYVDCRAVHEVLVTNGSQGLMRGELDIRDLVGL
ncbi:hypothetical protein [Aurantiacibacter suaedae]|uniref:hypothetical protein n=1 Tax=Aurantiacibacter suaedae TaxID=2545755 RepID=UPI0010F511F3|nr:hypothetical protein [Aurantiacibacter suaedae]